MNRPLRSWTVVCLLLLVVPGPRADPVYKIVGPDGKVTYSDAPPPAGAAESKSSIRSRTPSDDEDPVKAAMKVYANEIIVETAYRFCAKEVPETEPAVKQARDRWLTRHAELRSKKIVILHDRLSMDELRALAARSEHDNEAILDSMRKAPRSEREKWCRGAPQKFASPQMDLLVHLTLASTVMSYKPKK